MPSDAEEARLERAAALPGIADRYDDILAAPDAPALLWQRAVADVQAGHYDDRPLYWARLKLRRQLRERGQSLDAAERATRGFDAPLRPTASNVLITGFDPFHLDRDIGQSNPSGVAALALHGATIGGARVCASILPVRFQDFDQGIAEAALAERFRGELALALTISMGRDQFDLERFPGRRRSVETPDNRNVLSGASEANPRPPPGLDGPEFLEFSLPADALAAVQGRWKVRDNRTVCTLERGEVVASSLADLADGTAVRGSGGGYLSNEVAYRALLLQKRLGRNFPLGHIHTPALRGYDEAFERDIVGQLYRMVAAALSPFSRNEAGADEVEVAHRAP